MYVLTIFLTFGFDHIHRSFDILKIYLSHVELQMTSKLCEISSKIRCPIVMILVPWYCFYIWDNLPQCLYHSKPKQCAWIIVNHASPVPYYFISYYCSQFGCIKSYLGLILQGHTIYICSRFHLLIQIGTIFVVQIQKLSIMMFWNLDINNIYAWCILCENSPHHSSMIWCARPYRLIWAKIYPWEMLHSRY